MPKPKIEYFTFKIRKCPKQCYEDTFFYEVISPDLEGFSLIAYDQWKLADLLEFVEIFKNKDMTPMGEKNDNKS